MHPVIQTLKNALAYAKFADDDVRDATLELVDQIGTDLAPEYEQGSTVDDAVNVLEEALNNTDSVSEDTDAAIADGARSVSPKDDTSEDDIPV